MKPTVKFTIVNFTKKASLYTQGMRVNILSQKEIETVKERKLTDFSASGQEYMK